jgi:exosortase N
MSPETLLAPKSRTRYSQLIFTSPIWKDPIYAPGLIMLGASLIIYHIGGIFPAANNNDKFGSFTLNYLLTVVMLFLIPRCLNFFAWKMKTVEQENVARVLRINMVMNTLLLFILGMTVYATRDKSLNGELIPLKNISVPGYTATQLEHRVTKLYNENALVYIKPIAGFFSSDHQPMICWSGSGYEFTRIHEDEMGDTKVYAATLEKGDERLYTAWWYDNGISTTISQFEWRWDALKTRQHYAIVNVTAATPELLKIEVKKMILLKLGKRV